ncbi:hypothetical protein GF342_04360 [Candidatus Woesearchaeota archaeon]|nr:hypothetical protein [Candidatus Woesearchaeota archaeon]
MKIHYHGRTTFEGQAEQPQIMLTNRAGGYLLFSPTPRSRYEGVYFHHNNTLFKTIAQLEHSVPVKSIKHSITTVTRKYEAFTETFFMPPHNNGFVYALSKERTFNLILDCKESYDDREYGRYYNILQEENCLLIHAKKRNDYRDNNTTGGEYDVFIAVQAPHLSFKPVKEWVRHEYDIDAERHAGPTQRYVYKAVTLRATTLSFGYGSSKEQAIREAKHIFKNSSTLQREQQQQLFSPPVLRNTLHEYAITCAAQALQGLQCGDYLFAGLPWFFQSWARDTMISLKALLLLNEKEWCRQRLFDTIALLGGDACPGQLRTHPGTTLCTADGAGWLFTRIRDFLTLVKEGPYHFTRDDKLALTHTVEHYLNELKNTRYDGLIRNDKDQTWMDTSYRGDVRDGYRIEIQALALSTMKLYTQLSGKKCDYEKELYTNTRTLFNNGYLYDGKDDPTIRPNAFIAAYVYPYLLSQEEWESCFDTILPRLWLTWGGLSSIDKEHRLFTDTYTGETLQSYHRGDSWYWINNLVAIVLGRTNKKKYKKYIDKIAQASSQEILKGAIGHHAEVSSAKKQSSKGCVSQAWSAAMYLELMQFLHPRLFTQDE